MGGDSLATRDKVEEEIEAREDLAFYFPSDEKRVLRNGGMEFAVRSSHSNIVQELILAQECGNEGVGDGNCLDTSVWKHLPDDLYTRILEKLPFSSLIRFCCVNKRWNELIRSLEFHPTSSNSVRKCVPMYFDDDQPLTVFNRRKNSWQQISLSFLGTPTSMLSLLVSAGGLLCLKTGISGELIVCNPVTKHYRRLQVPCKIHHESISMVSSHAQLMTLYENPTSVRNMKSLSLCTFDKTVLVGIVMRGDGRGYKLIVAGVKSSGKSGARSTLVFDSLTNSWKQGGELPRGMRFWRSGKPVASNGYLYLITYNESAWACIWGVGCHAADPWSCVRYDVENDKWEKVHTQVSTPILYQLVEHHGRILVVQRRASDQTQILISEITEEGVAIPLIMAKMPVELFPEAVRRDVLLGDWCVGQGDRVFIAGVYPENNWQFSMESNSYRPPNVDRILGIGVLSFSPSDEGSWVQLPDLCGRYFAEGLYAFAPSLAKV